jgi:hypothetical protein
LLLPIIEQANFKWAYKSYHRKVEFGKRFNANFVDIAPDYESVKRHYEYKFTNNLTLDQLTQSLNELSADMKYSADSKIKFLLAATSKFGFVPYLYIHDDPRELFNFCKEGDNAEKIRRILEQVKMILGMVDDIDCLHIYGYFAQFLLLSCYLRKDDEEILDSLRQYVICTNKLPIEKSEMSEWIEFGETFKNVYFEVKISYEQKMEQCRTLDELNQVLGDLMADEKFENAEKFLFLKDFIAKLGFDPYGFVYDDPGKLRHHCERADNPQKALFCWNHGIVEIIKGETSDCEDFITCVAQILMICCFMKSENEEIRERIESFYSHLKYAKNDAISFYNRVFMLYDAVNAINCHENAQSFLEIGMDIMETEGEGYLEETEMSLYEFYEILSQLANELGNIAKSKFYETKQATSSKESLWFWDWEQGKWLTRESVD